MKITTSHGLIDPKWDRRFLELAKHISQWSKDPSTKCGVVLVDETRRVVSIGYNGFPIGTDDDPELYANRESKYKRVVHAEVNAIISAGKEARGCKLYSYPSFAIPAICCECAKVAIQAGITAVISFKPTETDYKRWADSIRTAAEMLREAEVDFYHIGDEEESHDSCCIPYEYEGLTTCCCVADVDGISGVANTSPETPSSPGPFEALSKAHEQRSSIHSRIRRMLEAYCPKGL